MDKILTLGELKVLVGSSESDAKLNFLLDSAHQQLADILDISAFGKHTVSLEPVKIIGNAIYTQEYPVDITEDIDLILERDRVTEDATTYSFALEMDNKLVIPENQFFRYSSYLMNYTAGYSLYDTLELGTNTGLNNKTIIVSEDYVNVTYTLKTTLTVPAVATEILIGATVNETATNIASKIGGTASTNKVTFPLGKTFVSTSTIPTVTHVANTIPATLKMAVSVLVSGTLVDQKKVGGVIEYTVSKKTIRFASESQARDFEAYVKPYLKYKGVGVYA